VFSVGFSKLPGSVAVTAYEESRGRRVIYALYEKIFVQEKKNHFAGSRMEYIRFFSSKVFP
jgi:hypothetical protein